MAIVGDGVGRDVRVVELRGGKQPDDGGSLGVKIEIAVRDMNTLIVVAGRAGLRPRDDDGAIPASIVGVDIDVLDIDAVIVASSAITGISGGGEVAAEPGSVGRVDRVGAENADAIVVTARAGGIARDGGVIVREVCPSI